MEILIIFLTIIVFFVIALPIWNHLQRKKGNFERLGEVLADPSDGECCGNHLMCEKDSLLNCFSEDIEYFDDEELDGYKGVPSEDYKEDQVEEFREIFYSMLDQDKPRWIRSLQNRNIEIPNQLKDEILMVVNDLRSSK